MEGTAVERRRTDMVGFERTDTAIDTTEAGALAGTAREEAEIRAAIVTAKHFPRSEHDAANKIVRACTRPTFAEAAYYRFPRGGSKIEGPSVRMAREAARCWGNIRSGIRVVSNDGKWIHIKGYALDLETNTLTESEDKFRALIQRKRGGESIWEEPDERDLRELMNRRGAICERNAILKIIPPDIIEEAMASARDTMQKAAAGQLEQDRESALRRITRAFSGYGVKQEDLESYLGNPLAQISAEQLTDLRGIWKSIEDGNSHPSEYFAGEPEEGAAKQTKTSKIKERVRKRASKEEEQPQEPEALTQSLVEQARSMIDRLDKKDNELALKMADEVEIAVEEGDAGAVRELIAKMQQSLVSLL